MADQGQRTEEPTERRVQKAREEGNFPVSREFVSALQFTAFVAFLSAFAADWLVEARRAIRSLLVHGFKAEISAEEVVRLFNVTLLPVAGRLLLVGAMLMAITAAVHLATTRLGISLKKLTPDLRRLDPVKKLRGLPRQNVPQFVQALVLLPLFLWVVYLVVGGNLGAFLSLPLLAVDHGAYRVAVSIRDLLWKACGLFALFGVIDLVRQRRRYRKDLKMTKQEIRDEFKEVEGNPHTKGRIRRLQRDLLRRQMMSDVPKAAAVVVNPTHYAVAIRYEVGSMAAPKVVAKGKNYLAQRIRRLALDHEVPIVENPPLARALFDAADVGQEIPVHLYRAVAEVLAYIYRIMNGRLPGAARPQGGA